MMGFEPVFFAPYWAFMIIGEMQ
jgi:hypothetical protein